jgi:hypothetical protein
VQALGESKKLARKLGRTKELAAAVSAAKKFDDAHMSSALKSSVKKEKKPCQFMTNDGHQGLAFVEKKLQEQKGTNHDPHYIINIINISPLSTLGLLPSLSCEVSLCMMCSPQPQFFVEPFPPSAICILQQFKQATHKLVLFLLS